VLAQDPRSRLNRRACLLVSGAAFWALCEVLWNTARDAETALALVRLSSLGWVALGPLGLEVLLEVAGRPAPRARRALPWLYGLAAVFLAVILTTDWVHERAVPAPWGFAYELGPPTPSSIRSPSGASSPGSERPPRRSAARPRPPSARSSAGSPSA
jgi:uncharacterized membrane protein YuzA (DUF378 family)